MAQFQKVHANASRAHRGKMMIVFLVVDYNYTQGAAHAKIKWIALHCIDGLRVGCRFGLIAFHRDFDTEIMSCTLHITHKYSHKIRTSMKIFLFSKLHGERNLSTLCTDRGRGSKLSESLVLNTILSFESQLKVAVTKSTSLMGRLCSRLYN